MKPTDVPSPGPVVNAIKLRYETHKVLNYAQVMTVSSPDTKVPEQLAEFFRSCADFCDSLKPKAAKAKKDTK